MITVRFACGHPAVSISSEAQAPPVCPMCAERRVSRVTAPAPAFRGFCVGPSAKTVALEAMPVAMKG